jgi:hypothetical protein
MLWTGTADSAVDLNPTELSGITGSVACATNGTVQVGYGYGPGFEYNVDLLWTGTAASAINLEPLLPGYTNHWSWLGANDTQAYSIDSAGNVYGAAWGTYDDMTGLFAVEWSLVPEPATGSLLLIAGAGILMRRRRQQSA